MNAGALSRPFERVAESVDRVRGLGPAVREYPRMHLRLTFEHRRDRRTDRNTAVPAVLRLEERQVPVLAVLPAELEQLADARASDERQGDDRAQLRTALLKQCRLFVR